MFGILSNLLLFSLAILSIIFAISTSAIAAKVRETKALIQSQDVKIHRPQPALNFAQITPEKEQETTILNNDSKTEVLLLPEDLANTSTPSVSQLSDVQPNDWAIQALQSLIEQYGCIAGYSDNTYRGDQVLTRSCA